MSHTVPWFTVLAGAFASSAALASPSLELTWSVEMQGELAVVSLHVASTSNKPVNVQVAGRGSGPMVTLANVDLAEAVEQQELLGMMSRAGSWPIWQETEGTRPVLVGTWTFPVTAGQTSLQLHGQVPTDDGTLPVQATVPLTAPGS